MIQTPTNSILLPRSHSASLTPQAWQIFLLKAEKVQPAPASPVSHHWNWGCLVVSVLYFCFKSQMDFWSESPKHPHLLHFSLSAKKKVKKVDPFQTKFHQKIDSQKATNTSQLVKSCSCQKHPVFGTSTEIRKGQLAQTTQMKA